MGVAAQYFGYYHYDYDYDAAQILDTMIKTIFQGPAPFGDHRIEKLNNKSNDLKINEGNSFKRVDENNR